MLSAQRGVSGGCCDGERRGGSGGRRRLGEHGQPEWRGQPRHCGIEVRIGGTGVEEGRDEVLHRFGLETPQVIDVGCMREVPVDGRPLVIAPVCSAGDDAASQVAAVRLAGVLGTAIPTGGSFSSRSTG